MSDDRPDANSNTIPKVRKEVEQVPPTVGSQSAEQYTGTSNTKIPQSDIDALERAKLDNRFLNEKRAFWLLVGCVAAMIVTYIFERIIIINFCSDTPDLGKTLFEILKFITSALIGFLFANRKD